MQHLKQLSPGTPVILANGLFPGSPRTLDYLNRADVIICCDGAIHELASHNLVPEVIVGDLDSLTAKDRKRFSDRLIRIDEQETNDLTKAIMWALENDYRQLVILGADGKRLDHTIGNASLVAEHCELATMTMITDHGTLIPVSKHSKLRLPEQ